MNKFFVRFALQRSFGMFGETFPYESIMKAEDGEIEAFIEECDSWQKKQAEETSSFIKNEPLEEIIEPDGIHLTPYGQTRFAKKWLETALTWRQK